MSFRNIITFWVFILYGVLSSVLFLIFSNYFTFYIEKRILSENHYLSMVAKDIIIEDGKNMAKTARNIANDDITVFAFKDNLFLGNQKWELTKDKKIVINPSKMKKLTYFKLANVLKNKVYGVYENLFIKSIQIFDENFELLGFSKGVNKECLNSGKEIFIRSVLKEKKLGGVETSSLYLKGKKLLLGVYTPIGKESRWTELSTNPKGVISIITPIDGIYLDKIKKILNREIILVIENEIVDSTIYLGNKRVKRKLKGIEIGNKKNKDQDFKKLYHEIEINKNKKFGFHFEPLYDFNNNVKAFIGVGYNRNVVEKLKKESFIRFIIIDIILSLLIFSIVYLVIKKLFFPFNNILLGIKNVIEGKYNYKIRTKASGELKTLKDSVNQLTTEVEFRESELRDLNNIIKEKNAKLVILDKMKDEFLANTSHELRTPLNGIIGLSEVLLVTLKEDINDKNYKNIEMIISSGKRLSRLVDNILDFSKMKKKQVYIDFKEVDLYECVHEVVEISKHQVFNKELKIINQINKEIPYVLGDRSRIIQILYNFIGNAIKFTKKGMIRVYSIEVDGFIKIFIEDTGIGISEDKFEKIFESFEQVDGSENRKYNGTGIGLAITKQLVELHKGKIELKSEINIGSTFSFNLIKSSEKRKNDSDKVSKKIEIYSEETSRRRDSKKILVVDDEEVNQIVLKEMLESENYNVITVGDGNAAIETIRIENFDLILLDVMMPGKSGFDVCKQLRKEKIDTPIIMISAKKQQENIDKALELGANAYLFKPINKENLFLKIKEIM